MVETAEYVARRLRKEGLRSAEPVSGVPKRLLVDEEDEGKVEWCVRPCAEVPVLYRVKGGLLKAMTTTIASCDNLVEYFYSNVKRELGVEVDVEGFYEIFEDEEAREKFSKIYPVLGAFIDMLERLVVEESSRREVSLGIRAPMADVRLVGRVDVEGMSGEDEAEAAARLTVALLVAYGRARAWLRDEAPRIFKETLEDAKRAMVERGR